MIKVTVNCENLFTEEKEDVDLYFHLTEAEIVSLNISNNNKYANYANMSQTEIGEEEIKLFEKLIEKAYGQRTADGLFIKDENAKKAFLCSPAYSALLMKLLNNDGLSLNEFILGCFPKDVTNKLSISEDGKVSIKK